MTVIIDPCLVRMRKDGLFCLTVTAGAHKYLWAPGYSNQVSLHCAVQYKWRQ